MREVQTELVLCLDADSEVDRRSLAPLLTRFLESNVGGATGRLWPSQTKSIP